MVISLVSFGDYVLFQLTEPKSTIIVSTWVSAKFCSGQKGVPILGTGWEPQLYVICGSCTSQSHLLLTQVQIILQVQQYGIFSIMFHLTVLFVDQIMYQACGRAVTKIIMSTIKQAHTNNPNFSNKKPLIILFSLTLQKLH